MAQLTDILIPLGQGSRHQNLELRYALRSIEKHLTGVGNIWIVGERPEWIQNVMHLRCDDSSNNWNRAHNIYRKIMRGINYTDTNKIESDLSDSFLFMNDDHFLLQDYSLRAGFPFYHRGIIDLPSFEHNIPQCRQYINTRAVLCQTSPLDFGVHCPIMYNKTLFKSVFTTMNKWPEYGFEIKSTYGNCVGAKGFLCDDLKFREPLMKETIYSVLEDRPWFSIGDRCLKSGGMKEVLAELYPNKSKWEL